jgi:undecaprenyl-diphosphatase
MFSLESTVDLGGLFFFKNLHRDALVDTAQALTRLGDRWFLGLVASAAAIGFVIARQPRTGICVCLTLVAAIGLGMGVKQLVKRPRPFQVTLTYEQISGWSFPSGHALESAALYGGLSAVLARRLRGRRWGSVVGVLGVLLPFVVGLTRMYLCFHYITDVLGGWCAGAALALLCGWADAVTAPEAKPEPGVVAEPATNWHAPPSEGVKEGEDRLQR